MPAVTVQQAFDLALRHHQAERLTDAEALYRQILAVEPGRAEALHFLGVIAHQAGRHALAIDWIQKAIASNPNNSAAHSNLGEAYRATGRLDEAIAAYRRALELQPDYPETENNLGNALRERGDLDESIAAYRRAIRLRHTYPSAHHNLGMALAGCGEFDEAIAAYRRALELLPSFAEAWDDLGHALVKQGRQEEAIAALRRALQFRPDRAESSYDLGNVLMDRGRLDEAATAYRHALEIQPGFAEAHHNLGAILNKQGHLDAAIAAYRRSLEIKPGNTEAHHNLGNALAEIGRFDEAAAALDRALDLDANHAGAKFSHSLLQLLRGDYQRGWPWYEARLDIFQSARRNFPQPMWDGGNIDGRRILLHAEQGFGDSIQCIRYARLIADRGGEVIVECPRSLLELFRSARGIHQWVAAGDPLPAFDVHVPMLSQPLLFQTSRESIPGETPYLASDPVRRAAWEKRLGDDRARLRVGLAWAGSPQNISNRRRNIPFEKLLPLGHVEGVEFHSLQVGHETGPTPQFPAATALIDHTVHLADFADTAAFMAGLDLIISVDTAVAHLAGALGRPVWTLLPFVPDWRWGLEGEDTPWYPTMRLFRQPARGDWETVIERVIHELEQISARHRSRTAPTDY
ncbi:MAG: tetratricopeptide repeat protein [Chthoniobacter sp.]|nr:tetratricopeptide repeat protein [Chthoniobacter sp.]